MPRITATDEGDAVQLVRVRDRGIVLTGDWTGLRLDPAALRFAAKLLNALADSIEKRNHGT